MQIVTCQDGVDVPGLIREFGIQPLFVYDAFQGFAAPLATNTLQQLRHDPRVRFVEADGPVTVCTNPPDFYPTQVGLWRMGFDHFPMSHINGTNELLDVGVAVLDSGIDPHPDLPPMAGAYSAYSYTDYSDTLGHGTAVAGVIAALDNGWGTVGVAPGVRLYNVKCIGPAPYNYWSYITAGMNWCSQRATNIAVVNISITNEGDNAPFSTINAYLNNMVRAGIVVVAAAGNGRNLVPMDMAGPDGVWNNGDDFYPASNYRVMAVSAMDPATDTLATFSNFSNTSQPTGYRYNYTNVVSSPGGAIDVAAPGVGIETLWTDLNTPRNYGYATVEGTSFAAPHVAGLVALYIAAHGRASGATPDEREFSVYRIRQAIVDSAVPQSQWHTNDTHCNGTNKEPLAVATEAWVPPPRITTAGKATGGYQVNFSTLPGYDYTVQTASALAAPAPWTNLTTVAGGSNLAPATVTDTNPAPQTFYRLERKPSP